MLNVIIITSIAIIATIIFQIVFVFLKTTCEQFMSTKSCSLKRWNSDDIDFFDLNLKKKSIFTKKAIIYVKKNLL